MPSSLTPTTICRAPRGRAVRARGRRRGRNSTFSDRTLMQQDTYPQILQSMGITMVPLGCTGHASNMIYQLRKVSMTFSSLRAPGTTHASPGRFATRRGRQRAISGAFERQSIKPERTACIQLCPPRSDLMTTCNLRFRWRRRRGSVAVWQAAIRWQGGKHAGHAAAHRSRTTI